MGYVQIYFGRQLNNGKPRRTTGVFTQQYSDNVKYMESKYR